MRRVRASPVVDVPVSGDVDVAWVVAHGLCERMLQHRVALACVRGDERPAAVEERTGGARPVAGAFFAARVGRVVGEEFIRAAAHFRDHRLPALRILLQQQVRCEDVRVDPRVPVVQAVRLAVEAHPTEVVAREVGVEDAALRLQVDALDDARRDGVELRLEQVRDPGDGRGRLRAEEFEDRLGDVRQTDAGLLRAKMRGHSPETFFADQPDAVGNLVEILAVVGDALGQDEVAEAIAAAKADGLEARAVAVALELEFVGGEHFGPRAGVGGVPAREDRLANLSRNGGPFRIAGLRVRIPRTRRQQRARERSKGARDQAGGNAFDGGSLRGRQGWP